MLRTSFVRSDGEAATVVRSRPPHENSRAIESRSSAFALPLASAQQPAPACATSPFSPPPPPDLVTARDATTMENDPPPLEDDGPDGSGKDFSSDSEMSDSEPVLDLTDEARACRLSLSKKAHHTPRLQTTGFDENCDVTVELLELGCDVQAR